MTLNQLKNLICLVSAVYLTWVIAYTVVVAEWSVSGSFLILLFVWCVAYLYRTTFACVPYDIERLILDVIPTPNYVGPGILWVTRPYLLLLGKTDTPSCTVSYCENADRFIYIGIDCGYRVQRVRIASMNSEVQAMGYAASLSRALRSSTFVPNLL